MGRFNHIYQKPLPPYNFRLYRYTNGSEFIYYFCKLKVYTI
jgi:hypothetical protein